MTTSSISPTPATHVDGGSAAANANGPLQRSAMLEGIPELVHGFSTRAGGVTQVYGAAEELNLGWTQEDDEIAVAINRSRLAVYASQTEHPKFRLVAVRQTHSADSVVIDAADLLQELSLPNGRAVLTGDGLITAEPGVLLGIQVADCTPVLVADPVNRVIAGFHAGWRGTAQRIVEKGVALMQERFGSRPEDLIAAVGPAIGPCCYQVGEELYATFLKEFAYGAELFSWPEEEGVSRPYLDLAKANRRQLLAAGLLEEKIDVLGQCTSCQLDAAGRRRYFSHRADAGRTGRMMAVIGLSLPAE